MSQRRIENDRLAVTIDDMGAELVSIRDKKNQREIVWQADPAYWIRHAPILFPNVGKYHQGGFFCNGQRYEEGQHGFARDKKMELTASGDDFVTHRLAADEDTRKRYPFEFSLEVTHRLKGNVLKVEWKVVNNDDKAMYFTIGAHPGFNVPVLPDTKYSDYYLQFPEDKDVLTLSHIDPETGTAIPGKKTQLELTDHKWQLDDELLGGTLVFDDAQLEWAGIAMPDGTPYVSVTGKGFSNYGIWSAPGAPFVCLEPWCGRCDDRGFEDDISKKENINKLESGEVFEKSYDITIY